MLDAPLEGDGERWRWYSEGGEACWVLSERGRLLEPLPIFGPSCYVLIASGASYHDANRYAIAAGYRHIEGRPEPAPQGERRSGGGGARSHRACR